MSKNSHVHADNLVSGAASALYGLAVEYNSHVTFDTGTLALLGTTGQVIVGTNAATTFATIQGGLAADVNDYGNASPGMCTALANP